jgi:kinesin family member 5
MKSNEIRSLNTTIDGLKSVNEELKVMTMYEQLTSTTNLISQKRAFAVTSAGIEGGKNLAESAQDLERTRKAINVQLAEFDGVKKSLVRDLQNRCEKVRIGTFHLRNATDERKIGCGTRDPTR